LQSVIEQDYPNIEYIIIDGASTDGTLDVINKYGDGIARVESGKDGGIYYALNKGLSLATGDLVAFLHADDFYAHKHVISNVVQQLEKIHVDSLYGNLNYVDRECVDKIVRKWRSGTYYHGRFSKGWMPPHPAFFLKRSCYEKYGVFNTDFRTAADYELMLRMLHKHKVSTTYLPEVLVLMRTGGQSNVSIRNRIRANLEDRMAWRVNGLSPDLFTFLRKPLSKLKQFISR
jgi:glycosyltransferase